MPVIGAVVTLSSHEPDAEASITFMKSHPNLSVGEIQKNGLPIAIESNNKREENEIWSELEAQAGISFLKVVCVDFSDVIETQEVEASQ